MGDNKPKIGIMTWYTYKNYGTALQASALCYILQKTGNVPYFIQYIPKGEIITDCKISLSFFLKKVINKFTTQNKQQYLSNEAEQRFLDYLNPRIKETMICKSYPELYGLNTEYDAFVCGSDQIWSPLCYDDKYFLSFVSNPEKMIAYAPSIGSTVIENQIIREKMAKHISRFKHLSVREQQGADIICQLTGKDARVVLDPTLLMDTLEWDDYIDIANIPKISGDYIVCYFLGNENKYMRYVHKLSKQMKLPYYIIPVTVRQKKADAAVPFAVGPGEFVSLIKNARHVCTDSFHGMAFSVNYNIPFSVFKRFHDNDPKNQNSRIFNLLELLGLEDRLVNPKNEIDTEKLWKCDFNDANFHLKEQRRQSMEYLTMAVAQAVNAVEEIQSPQYKITEMCCGCGACTTVCPSNAVTVSQNDEGFQHYKINPELCIQCGKCRTVCSMARVTAPQIRNAVALYAVKSNSAKVLKVSSSGGIAHELAELCQSEKQYVSGCMYDSSDNLAKHIVIASDEPDKLLLLQGSKYIQSVSVNAMKQIGEIAKIGSGVFFGTPCQVAAVDKILRREKKREQILLVDLICHGVPSYFLWDKYLNEIDKKYHIGKHPKVMFRSKEFQWRRRLLFLAGNNHQYRRNEDKDDFYAFFRRGLCYMEVCSDCPYRERSAADLRIGDYWGTRFKKDKQGVSMVIANTLVGNKFVTLLKDRDLCSVQEYNLSEYWTVQFPYNPPKPLVREQLIAELKENKKSIHQLRKEYCHYYDVSENLAKMIQKFRHIIKRG